MSVRRRNIPCRFYGTFGCKFGNNCRFNHSYYESNGSSSDRTEESPSVLCPFFLADCCKFGEKCRNSHVKVDLPSDVIEEDGRISSEAEKECGICMDPAPNTLYGLMSHCDCKFCLTCIRKWRNVALSPEQVRLCPLCRVESSCVIPSRDHLNGELKRRLVDACKVNAANTPCKYDSKGIECPFATRCFYRHDDRKRVQTRRMFHQANYYVDDDEEDDTMIDLLMALMFLQRL